MANNIKKRILVAPLDWGLGHTTRSVPLIRFLLELGHSVIVAGNEQQRSFIAKLFSNVELIHLNGYNIVYAANEALAKIKVLSQIPGILHNIQKEHLWLLQQAHGLAINGIISDNRYGLYHPDLPSVIMTHQLQVQTGMGYRADRVLQKMHYRYLEKFDEVWVPDIQGRGNIAGNLSHPAVLPANTKYIGALSQFDESDVRKNSGEYLMVLLSGPEPQRTILSGILLRQLRSYTEKVVFVTGVENAVVPAGLPGNIAYYGRLAGKELAEMIFAAHTIICRSGYSTIMDVLLSDKKAILIPTPGQTEQEYLGKHLYERGLFYSVKQKDFDLENSLAALNDLDSGTQIPAEAYQHYRQVLSDWLTIL